MKTAVVTFPGSNCDQDAVHVMRNLLGRDVARVWHKDRQLPEGTNLVILPGGFSYGDALRSGSIATNSPIMAAVKEFADRGGFVLGICNGFQVLLESRLLPGAMLQNADRKFVCRQEALQVVTAETPFTSDYEAGAEIRLPVAHHEGCYYAPDDVMKELASQGQIVFRYMKNPNGSTGDVAGLCNPGRNVLGMMPHPERAAEDVLGNRDGRRLFESIARTLDARGAA